MENEKLLRKMYYFAIELAQGLPSDKFNSLRDKWNKLMTECEKTLKI